MFLGATSCKIATAKNAGHTESIAEQVIKQIWISPHFGVLSRYSCAADSPFPFIRPVVLPPHSAVKRLLTIFQLAATRAPALAGVGSEWRLDKT
jgi:hypothetical protein